MEYDAVVAGCGISGLLLGSELAPRCRLLLIEQRNRVPKNKYWLTNRRCTAQIDATLQECIDQELPFLDFIAYDDTKARLYGEYVLWNTNLLVEHLREKIRQAGVTILTDHRFHAYRLESTHVAIRTNEKEIRTRLFIDCMGYGSPLITGKGIVDIIGYYLMHGTTFETEKKIDPIGLHNVMIQERPTYFEAFPTRDNLVHAAMIAPARHTRDFNALVKDFQYVTKKSQYCQLLTPCAKADRFFGIIPVGRIRKRALDRIYFYGEAGQVNPATSATGLTRMLSTYLEVANFLLSRMEADKLDRKSLSLSPVQYMTPKNRSFQEALFSKLLDFKSDEFKALVEGIRDHDSVMINDLIFADYSFSLLDLSKLYLSAPRRIRKSILFKYIVKSLVQNLPIV